MLSIWLVGTALFAVIGLLTFLYGRSLLYQGHVKSVGLMTFSLCWAWPIILAFTPVLLIGVLLYWYFTDNHWI